MPIRMLAYITATAAYLLIVLGGVVRITGSGMGCGDDWPLCNGRLIPPLDDVATLIEWSHRLVAAGLSVLVVGLAALAWRQRRTPGIGGPGGALRSATLALGLLVVQVLLGAVTVWLELPPTAVILHLGTAMAMLAALQVTGLRTASPPTPYRDRKSWRGAMVAVGLTAAALLLGGLTANLGAAGACTGFPLCNGAVWPRDAAGGLAHIHWMHRLVAYGLALHLVGLALAMRRRGASVAAMRAAWLAVTVTVIQVAVAAAMVLTFLSPHWRAIHVAAGTAVWMVVVWLAWEVRPARGIATAHRAADATA